MVLAEFSIFPTDKGESVSEYVAQVLQVVDESGIEYRLTPMGTILEGSWEEVMAVVTDCFRTLEKQSNRVTLNFKMDYRKGEQSRLTSKTEKVEKLLHKPLRK